jgi:hypothetical protein
VDVNPFGPVQLYVTPGVVEEAVRVTQVAPHVIVPPVATMTGGALMTPVLVEAGLVQPATVLQMT